MTSQVALDRIQGYLRQLTPQERGRLLVEMERLQVCGQGIAGIDAIAEAYAMVFLPDGKLVRSADLAKGRPIPAVKVLNPLRISDIPPVALSQIHSR